MAGGPTAIAVAGNIATPTVYAGFANGPVQRLNASDGTPQTSILQTGNVAGKIGGVVALAIGPANPPTDVNQTLWVLDDNLRVQQFALDGTFIRGFSLPACAGGNNINLLTKGGLEVTSTNVYVAHPCDDKVLRYSRSDLSTVAASVTLNAPKGLAIGNNGSAVLDVAQPVQQQIAYLNPTTLAITGTFVLAGNPYANFKPADVDSDSNNVLYVADIYDFLLEKYNATTGQDFGYIGPAGSGDGKFDNPVAFENYGGCGSCTFENNVFVADNGNNRVQRLSNGGFMYWKTTLTDAPVPANTALPQITGTASIGQTLSCSQGTWTNSPTSYGYQWSRDGTALGAATTNQYTIQNADIGHQLTCTVTAFNDYGSTPATSASVTPTAPPVNTAVPTISGSPVNGNTLTCNPGTWTNNPTFTYQWKRDGTTNVGTGSTYALVNADVGHQISCTVKGTNGAGNSSADSAAVTVTQIPAPVNSARPAISGTPGSGQTLSCSSGTWSNNPTGYAYQWKRDGTTNVGTGATYVVAGADVGHALTCTVTASNDGGAGTPATSDPTTILATPVNTTPPSITPANPSVGTQLTCNTTAGDWTGSPDSFAYSWTVGGNVVAGQSTKNYTTVAGDSGKQAKCMVIAHNAAGNSAPVSSALVTIVPPVPGNTSRPVISGSATTGGQLSCDKGSWSFVDGTSAYAYSWRVDGGATVSAISTYTVQQADLGHTLTCTVIASNTSGNSAPATSDGVVPDNGGASGAIGVTMNNGATFTNSADVTLTIHEPASATSALISNDSGFATSTLRGIRADDTYSWTLAGSSSAQPKKVYVRFNGPGVNQSTTYSDEITLDTEPPVIDFATLQQRRSILRVGASDAVSGVGSMQVGPAPDSSAATRAYFPASYAPGLSRNRWVRVIDNAGNASDWTQVSPVKARRKHRHRHHHHR